MPDLTLAELSDFLTQQGFDNEIIGDGSLHVTAVGTLEDAGPGETENRVEQVVEDGPGSVRVRTAIAGCVSQQSLGTIPSIREKTPCQTLPDQRNENNLAFGFGSW